MEKLNYSQIYNKITKNLSPKTRDVFDRRFGIKVSKRSKLGKEQTVRTETLESIGQSFGITRERVRQVQDAGFNSIRKHTQEIVDNVFKEFNSYFETQGGFKKEDLALQDLGQNKNQPYVLFFLNLGEGQFSRVCGKKDYHYFWSTLPQAENKVKETLNSLVADIENYSQLLTKEELLSQFASKYNLNSQSLSSYLEISKQIQANKEGKFGLADWPEIKPKGVRDKALLVFRKHQKPLHFRQLSELIDQLEFNEAGKKTHPQTVHNELIKDPRFVLVGRGTYALSEWGYVSGTIKDLITKILKENHQPLTKDNIVKEILSQRLVSKNTVLINLNNKEYFQKDPQGRYFLRQAQAA